MAEVVAEDQEKNASIGGVVARAQEPRASMEVICAEFRAIRARLPIDQGLAPPGGDAWRPDVDVSDVSAFELWRVVQVIADTPATTAREFLLKKEIAVECMNRDVAGTASPRLALSLLGDFDRLTGHRRPIGRVVKEHFPERFHVVSGAETIRDDDVSSLCDEFWGAWTAFTGICDRVSVLDAAHNHSEAILLNDDVLKTGISLQRIIAQLAGIKAHSFDELFGKRDVVGACLGYDGTVEYIADLVASFSHDIDRLFGSFSQDEAMRGCENFAQL